MNMRLAIQAGVHHTEFSQLNRCLRLNSRLFFRHGSSVANANSNAYLSDFLSSATQPDWNGEFDWKEIIAKQDLEKRVVITSENFFGGPIFLAGAPQFYSNATPRLSAFLKFASPDELKMVFTIRNPATFLPSLYEGSTIKSFSDMVRGADPRDFKWSEMVLKLSREFPEVSFHIFCYEDLPMVWGDMIRLIGDLEPSASVRGEYSFVEKLMKPAGYQRLISYISGVPELSALQRRRVLTAFLDKYAIQEKIEQSIDIEGWSEDFIDILTKQYEDDLQVMTNLPNVNAHFL
ncbi:MAG: hypothetical protein AAFO17_10835 [Pseudomonadota bacterium]